VGQTPREFLRLFLFRRTQTASRRFLHVGFHTGTGSRGRAAGGRGQRWKEMTVWNQLQ
jgi:hypothetical protein